MKKALTGQSWHLRPNHGKHSLEVIMVFLLLSPLSNYGLQNFLLLFKEGTKIICLCPWKKFTAKKWNRVDYLKKNILKNPIQNPISEFPIPPSPIVKLIISGMLFWYQYAILILPFEFIQMGSYYFMTWIWSEYHSVSHYAEYLVFLWPTTNNGNIEKILT